MIISHLIQAAIDWSLLFGGSCGPVGAPCPCNTAGFLGLGGQLACPGSAFTPVAAAYQTQGMWVQADLIHQIRYTGLSSLAALMYLVSAIGGLIGVALGAPPKMYLWFFMGPPMYHFLVGTPYALKGTEWKVGNQPQDQRQVWKMAEVGLLNSNWIDKSRTVYSDGAPGSTVDVSWFFAYYDRLVSSVIQNITAWTGLYNMRGSTQGIHSGVGPAPSEYKLVPGSGKNKEGTNNWLGDRWWLLTNSKWSMIENITNSKLASPKIRDALATFMSSECGDSMMSNMNSSAFLNAMYYKGRQSPGSVFRNPENNQNIGTEDYERLFRNMYPQNVPMPRSIRDMLKDRPADKSSLAYTLGLSTGEGDQLRLRMLDMPTLQCPAFLHILLNAFRWEAGQIYHQFLLSAPDGIDEQWLAYYLFYGWNIRKGVNGQPRESWPHIENAARPEFIKNLILVHLIRNEMMIMPMNFTNRKLSTRVTEDSGEGHLRFIATKNKFSEMYQWALMVPHMQGILLYYLAIAFPFCAMMMVVPGYHKVTFTWMTFWLWAKMWDLGFAMVTALERSVWAMVGNKSEIQGNLHKIAEITNWAWTSVTACKGSNCDLACSAEELQTCLFSSVELRSSVGNGMGSGISLIDNLSGQVTSNFSGRIGGAGSPPVDLLNYDSWTTAVRIFDRAITVAANLDLDLSNSYYIYIMAGLYLSVPVVVGQLVLGAKSGSASLVGNIIGAVGQEAGRQGSAGHSSDMLYRMKAAKASVGQEAYAKQMRASGLAGAAIGHGNEQILAGMNRAGLEAAAGGARAISGAANLTRANAVEAAQVIAGAVSAATGVGAETNKALRERNKSPQPPRSPGSDPVPTPAGPNGLGDPGNRQVVTPKDAADGMKSWGAGIWDGAKWVGAGGGALARDELLGLGLSAGGQAFGALVRAGNYEAQRFAAHSEQGANIVGMQSAIQGFGYGQQSALQGASEQRVGAQAEFDARSAAWEAENAYSNQFASLSTALGLFAGGLDAGSKPVDKMGMAMSGDLGSPAFAAAQAATPGNSMWGRLSDVQGGLESQYNQNRLQAAYFAPDSNDLWSWGGNTAAAGFGSLVKGIGPDASQDRFGTGTVGETMGAGRNNSAVDHSEFELPPER